MQKYSLQGLNGNAFYIMGYVTGAMKDAGFTIEEINIYVDKCTSGDYNNVILQSEQMLEECNNILEFGGK